LLNLFGMVLEVMATIVVEMVAWLTRILFRRDRSHDPPAVARQPRALPEGVGARIVAALTAGNDPSSPLPKAWRSFHSSILDAPSPKAGDQVAVGAELSLVLLNQPDDEVAARYVVVAPLPGTTAELGTLTNDELDRPLKLGRVRCWLAGRKQTLLHPAAAIVFIAVYDP